MDEDDARAWQISPISICGEPKVEEWVVTCIVSNISRSLFHLSKRLLQLQRSLSPEEKEGEGEGETKSCNSHTYDDNPLETTIE